MQTRSAAVERAGAVPAPDRWLPRPVVDRGRELWARVRPTPIEPEPYEAGVTRLAQLLMRPGLMGLGGVLAMVAGASFPTSPFTLTQVPGSWFFGIPPPPLVSGVAQPAGSSLLVGIVLFYSGLLLLLRAWYEVYRITVRHPGLPVRRLVPLMVAWTVPLLIVAPILSRDVYSYVAQGEMMSHGINPYSFGPAVLGFNSWVSMVDPLWQNVTSPYGPLFLSAAGAIVSVTGHNPLLSIIGMRLLALGGVVLIAVFLPRLARSYGHDGSTAFTLGVLNPIVLVHLIGGAHNDALMLGLLVAGLTYARSRRPVVGAVLVALAACVKIPAAIGLVYIGWEWLGDDVSWRERIRALVSTFLVGGAVMLAVTEVVGLGWGWIGALGNPDTLIFWSDPATTVGLISGHLLHALRLGDVELGMITASRVLGGLAAAAIGLRLLLRSNSRTSGRALGLTFLAVTLLGPVIEPWYLAWAIVLLAAVGEVRVRVLVIALTCVFSLLGLPGGLTVIRELSAANPLVVVAGSLCVVGITALMLTPWLRRVLAGAATDRRTPLPERSTL